MPTILPIRLHATAIALGDRAAAIRGPSGSGKSDLALRCLAQAPTALVADAARLIADDYTELYEDGGTIRARAPEAIAGLLEVRGLGIIELETQASARLALVVDLAGQGEIERLPDASTTDIAGHAVPLLRLDAAAPSAAIKLLVALSRTS